MNKSAIIIKTPKCCHCCRFWFANPTDPVRYICTAAQKYIENLGGKPKWCPLREIKENLDLAEYQQKEKLE